ncbi:hypothetical protein ABPG77_010514 [Micractinium sp. CCAP 211/92]
MFAVKAGVQPVMAALLACLLLHATPAAMTGQAGTSRLRTPRLQHAASGGTFPATNLHARRLLGSQLPGANTAAAATLTAPAPAIAQAVVSQVAQHFAFLGLPKPEASRGARASISPQLTTRPLFHPAPSPPLHRPPLLGGALASRPPLPPPPPPPAPAPSPYQDGSQAGTSSVLGLSTVPKPPRLRTRITPVLPLDIQFPPTALPEPPVPLVDVTGNGTCLEQSSVLQQGALGDGKRDNAAALRSADARPGPPVLYFLPGTYRVASNLTLTKAVVMGINTRFLVDTGATLRLARKPRRPPVWGDALFTGPGRVLFTSPGLEVYPSWWKSWDRADGDALQAAVDSCSQAWCRLVQTRVVSLTGGGVSLHPRVRYFSTASGNIRGNGGSGQGVTLLPGTYTQPLSFTGLYNLTQWGLRVLPGVRGANIQAGFVSHNYQGLLLTAGDGAVGAALRGVVFSHISVMQSNQYSVVFNSITPSTSLFDGVTVRVNFDLMGGSVRPSDPAAGVFFQGGAPMLRNTQMVVQAIDPNQPSTGSRYAGVATQPGLPPVRNFVYRAELWIGGYTPTSPGYITGSFSNSFFSIFVTAPRWSASLLALSPGSTDNFINCGLVASASAYYSLASTFGDLSSFNGGSPMGEQGFYVKYQLSAAWQPGEGRTFYAFSPYAQGITSRSQPFCVPFRTQNPGLVCRNITRAPAADSAPGSYQVAIRLENQSKKPIPAGYLHIFGIQLTP